MQSMVSKYVKLIRHPCDRLYFKPPLALFLLGIIILVRADNYSFNKDAAYNSGGCTSARVPVPVHQINYRRRKDHSRTAITWFNWSALPLFGPLSGIVSAMEKKGLNGTAAIVVVPQDLLRYGPRFCQPNCALAGRSSGAGSTPSAHLWVGRSRIPSHCLSYCTSTVPTLSPCTLLPSAGPPGVLAPLFSTL